MPNRDPRLAIIIPSFNYERYVGRAIESVLRQERADCELIVVDDGSTDGSWDVITSYGIEKSFRVDNGGQAKACFYGLSQTRAPFALFLDADDELKPGSLERILSHLDPGVAKVQFALTLIDADGSVVGQACPSLADFRKRQELIDEVVATGSYTNPPTSGNVFRRDVCMLLGEVDYECWVDGVLLFAAPFFGDVVSLSVELGCYRLHGRNHSQLSGKPDAERFRKEAERFLSRLDHLARILSAAGSHRCLPKGQETFFYRERQLYREIAEGQRPNLASVLILHGLLLRQPLPLNNRIGLHAFLWFSLIVSKSRRTRMLSYRFQIENRSALGLLKTLV